MVFKEKIASVFVALALTAASITGAAGQSLNEYVERGYINIGVLGGVPPYTQIDESGKLVGYDVDLANIIGGYMGVEVRITSLTNPSRIPALTSGQVDIAVALAIPTPERALSVMFTQPYVGSRMAIFAPNTTEISAIDDLAGKRIGVPRASAQDALLTRMNLEGAEVARFDDDASVAQAMLVGQVDAIALPEVIGLGILEKVPSGGNFEYKTHISVTMDSIAVRQGDFELLQWLNNVIAYMKSTGELNDLHRKWVGTDLPELPVF